MPDWTDLHYLQHGNRCQQRAYTIITALKLWTVLADFKPLLAGTIPLAIDIAGSDLDILCEVPAPETQRFCELLQKHYGHRADFRLTQLTINGEESVVCSFRYRGREIEVFAQAVPVLHQNGFRHLVVEEAVLYAGGEAWRRAVRQLKKQGLKTEPAFAFLLRLAGNPYVALLELEGKSIAELQAYIAQNPIILTC